MIIRERRTRNTDIDFGLYCHYLFVYEQSSSYQKPVSADLHKLAPWLITVEGCKKSQVRKMVAGCAESTGGDVKLIRVFYVVRLGLMYGTSKGEQIN